jgi:hypothetical protein
MMSRSLFNTSIIEKKYTIHPIFYYHRYHILHTHFLHIFAWTILFTNVLMIFAFPVPALILVLLIMILFVWGTLWIMGHLNYRLT